MYPKDGIQLRRVATNVRENAKVFRKPLKHAKIHVFGRQSAAAGAARAVHAQVSLEQLWQAHTVHANRNIQIRFDSETQRRRQTTYSF
jgi:hypothetical protein